MAEQIGYKPDYLKLEPKELTGNIGSAIIELEHGNLPFGLFSTHILNSSEKRWAVLRFDPSSKDLNSGDKYETRQAALDEAVSYLNQKGFYASHFDLEALVDKVEIQK